MAMTVLLTGGAGYIGSHVYVALAKAGYRAIILDNFSNAQEDVPQRLARLVGQKIEVHQIDIRDAAALDTVFARHKITAVIHFAARKSVEESFARPLDYIDNNLVGLVNLLKSMRRAGVFRLVFSSSATVYGPPQKLPIAEDAETKIATPYGFTKLACEQLLAQVAIGDPRWTLGVLRYFNPVGAHPSNLIGEEPVAAPANLMPNLAKVALGELRELRIFGSDFNTPDGTGVRDYIHVDDLAEGHVLSLRHLLATGDGHVVNIGTGRGYSVLELLHAYSKTCGRDLPYVIAPRRRGDIAACYADPRKAEMLLGFRATRDLADMCRTSWAWTQRRAGLAAD